MYEKQEENLGPEITDKKSWLSELAKILFVLLIAAFALSGIYEFFIRDRIFPQSRVKQFEQLYSVEFPEGTEFEDFSQATYRKSGKQIHSKTLYIRKIEDPEEFCRSCINGKRIYTEDLSDQKENSKTVQRWNNGDRIKSVFMCSYTIPDCGNKEGITVNVYFFNNSSESYDAKLNMQYYFRWKGSN